MHLFSKRFDIKKLHSFFNNPPFLAGFLTAVVCICLSNFVQAQVIPEGVRVDNQGRPMGSTTIKGGDSLQQRDRNEDSITIYYKMFDSTRVRFIDSSLSDFSVRFPLPADYLYLNQLGGAAKSVLFKPNHTTGYDPGYHGYDVYHFNLQNTRFFNTTRPYTELDYILGGKAEQTIKLLHTQNIKPLWNATFDYRLVNSPGHFKNSSSNHSSVRFSSDFMTKNRRYSGVFVFFRNKSKVNENGGILNDSFLVSKNQAYNERFNIPTWIGGDVQFSTNFFSSSLAAGNSYYEQTVFYRQQYDLGKKEESYNADSVLIRKFYPRLRLQHNLIINNRGFQYTDSYVSTPATLTPYTQHFGYPAADTPLILNNRWREVTNEGAIILFPEKNNQDQFLKMGAGFQILKGWFAGNGESFDGSYLMGEYRNRTRNRKWDFNANGKLFLTGPYSGNFSASGFLQTNLGKKIGQLRLGFQNTNRNPAYVFEPGSDAWKTNSITLNNENWTTISGELFIQKLGLNLKTNYHLISNYTYWKSYTEPEQDSKLENVIQISAEKKFKLNNHWNWYAELHIQQSSSAGINLPLAYTRHRIAYEGNFYKNLFLSTGFEIRYFSPFTADDWSPFNGQWIAQSQTQISNLPDLAAFLHFRIASFRAFIRAENLNTIDFSNGFGWTNNNLSAPLYPTPGFLLRFGIYWSFVN